MAQGKFGTAINCMDGRVQLPVINWLKQNYALDYVDMITEPGPDKIVAGQGKELESIKTRVLVSAKAHGSQIIAVAGHHDCAGNPVSREEHQAQLKRAAEVIRSWNLPFKEVIALWVGENWATEIVYKG
jgi:carbonic anhydrase